MRSRHPFAASPVGLKQQIDQLVMCRLIPIPPHPNFRFHPTRKWELDFAWPEYKVGVEYQGIYMRDGGLSGHQTPKGMRRDWEKLNEAQLLGWIVLQFGADETQTGAAAPVIERAIKLRKK